MIVSDVMNAVLSGSSPSREAFEQYYREFHSEVESATEASLAGITDAEGRETYDRLAESVALPCDAQVLDVGCGDGAFLARFLRRCPNAFVSGIDLSEAEIRRAGSRLPREHTGQLVAGSAVAMPFADRAFDAVFSHMVLMLIPDVDRVFAEVRRVLRDRAPFAFLIPRPPDAENSIAELLRMIPQWVRERHPSFTPVNPGDPRVWSHENLTDMLTSSGFGEIAFDDFSITGAVDVEGLIANMFRRYYLGSLPSETRSHVETHAREWAKGHGLDYCEPMRIVVAR